MNTADACKPGVEVDPFLIAEAVRGTVVRHPVRERTYWVRGTECVYQVKAWLHQGTVVGHCPCKGFAHRKTCLHVTQVAAYVRKEALCPACGGKGWLHDRPGERWATPGPVMLGCCLGTGLRSEWERMGRLIPAGQFAATYCPEPVARVDEHGLLTTRPLLRDAPSGYGREEAALRAMFA